MTTEAMTIEQDQSSKKNTKSAVKLSESLIAEIDAIKDTEGFDSRESVIQLLLEHNAEYLKIKKQSESALNFEQDLDESDFETLQEICESDNITYKDFAKSAIATVTKKYRTQSENKPDFESMSLEDLEKAKRDGKGRTYKGMAEARLGKIAEMVMVHNDEQADKSFKWFITANLLAKLSGSNRVAVNTFVKTHEIMINDHNAKHGLVELDNRKGIGGYTVESFKAKLGL